MRLISSQIYCLDDQLHKKFARLHSTESSLVTWPIFQYKNATKMHISSVFLESFTRIIVLFKLQRVGYSAFIAMM